MRFVLHHVALSSPKAAEAADFYGGEWGLHEVGRDGPVVRLGTTEDRGDDYSLVLVTSERKTVDHFCLVTEDEADFETIEQRVRDRGVTLIEDMPACPGLAKVFHLVDLDGRRIEIGYRPRSAVSESGEVRDAVPVKLGHIVLNTPDIQAATDWYQDKLGFGLRDWRAKKMSFLYYNEDHHTVAFSAAPHASLNHLAYDIRDINQFFRAVGRMSETERGEKLYGPGRHGPGEYVFYYYLDPMGFVCEYETEGVRVTDAADYQFRVWEYTPESADQWLGTLSGGPNQRWRKAMLGEPDPSLAVTNPTKSRQTPSSR